MFAKSNCFAFNFCEFSYPLLAKRDKEKLMKEEEIHKLNWVTILACLFTQQPWDEKGVCFSLDQFPSASKHEANV